MKETEWGDCMGQLGTKKQNTQREISLNSGQFSRYNSNVNHVSLEWTVNFWNFSNQKSLIKIYRLK